MIFPGLPGEYDCAVFVPSRPGNDGEEVFIGYREEQTGGSLPAGSGVDILTIPHGTLAWMEATIDKVP